MVAPYNRIINIWAVLPTMTIEEIAFININSCGLEQQWLSSLLRMCFHNSTVVTYDTIDDLSLESHIPNSVLCCNEKDLKSIASVLKESNTFFPILVLSASIQKDIKLRDQEHFTLEIIPREMLSPGLFKLALSSLLRDYKKEQQLKALAHYDPLTGTANRNLFYDRLKQAIKLSKRNGTPLSVIYFDLDKFKPVNDTYGHHVGDLLLKSFSKKVKSCLRDVDTLGRLGGDEFSAILTNTSRAQAETTAERIIDSLNQAENLDGHDLTIQTSIGIVTCSRSEKLKNLSHERLMKTVDAVTYKAKRDGKHRYISQEI